MDKIHRSLFSFLFSFIFFIPVFAQPEGDIRCISGDCVNGLGIQVEPDGVKYTGNFKGGRKHGRGEQVWPNGTRYVGDFVYEHMLGSGTIYYPNGEVYIGMVHGGKRQGKGQNTWPNGTSYEGDWMNNEMEGTGILRYPSGTRYEGTFKASKREGTGTQYQADNNISYSGKWVNDQPAGPEGSSTKTLLPSFCMQFGKLVKDIDSNFKNTLGPKEKEKAKKPDESYHIPNVQLPDAVLNTMHNSGTANTYISHLGEYKSLKEAEARLDFKQQELAECLGDAYYMLESATLPKGGKEQKRLMIGKKEKDGFQSPFLHMSIAKDEEIFTVVMYMFGGKTSKYNFVEEDSITRKDEKFAAALEQIMAASLNDYKGHKKDTLKGDSKADLPSLLTMPGGSNCRVVRKTDLRYKGHVCTFYFGSNETMAKNTYFSLFEKVYKILGPGYVYNNDDFWKVSQAMTEFSRFNEKGPKVKIAVFGQAGGKFEVVLMVNNE
jgi:hypothetical protein